MKYAIMVLVYLVGGAIGTGTTLQLETTSMSFPDRVLLCTIVHSIALIVTLLVIGVLATRNYIRECRTHRIIMERLHNLGLPK